MESLPLVGTSSFTVRFPASSGALYFDPIVDLVLAPDKDEFWETAWFMWSAGALAVLVSEFTRTSPFDVFRNLTLGVFYITTRSRSFVSMSIQ